jgi:hypothetical protein
MKAGSEHARSVKVGTRSSIMNAEPGSREHSPHPRCKRGQDRSDTGTMRSGRPAFFKICEAKVEPGTLPKHRWDDIRVLTQKTS